ncbi:MAG: glycosyltransferase family 2 protein [Parcubacteria group bacterium]|jgi:hypothetical protein
MKLSIQIVNYNSRECLRECIASLLPFISRNSGNVEIIVINNDADPIGDFLNHLDLGSEVFRVLEINKNIGFGKAHNKGIPASSGSFVMFLNPDTRIEGGSLDKMLAVFETDQKIAVIGPLLFNRENKVQKDCYGFKKTPFSIISSKLKKNNWLPENIKFFEVDWVSGGAMMIRRDALSAIGGFDENYFMYFEDIDLCLRAVNQGWKVVVNPEARIFHESGKSFASEKEKKKHYYASQNYYLHKNYGQASALLAKLLRFPYYLKNVYLKK